MSSIDVFAANLPMEKTERTNRSLKNGLVKNNQKENLFLNKRFSNIKAIKHIS